MVKSGKEEHTKPQEGQNQLWQELVSVGIPQAETWNKIHLKLLIQSRHYLTGFFIAL